MQNKKIQKLIFLFLLLFFLLGANFVFVSEAFALEITYPRVPGAAPPQDFLKTAPPEDALSLYAKYLVNLCIWAAGMIALAGLIYGGILYLISTGKPDRMVLAKNQISAAFFGLLLLLSSYLVLSILSPQFIILKIPKPEPTKVITRPPVPPAPTKEFQSAINTEIPFGTIIEKGIFAGAIISCDECGKGAANICDEAECLKIGPWCEFRNRRWGDCIEKETPRIPRIYNNSVITKTLADNLKQQSEDLYDYSHKCTCRKTDPDPPCGNHRLGNTTWKCDCGGCSATEPCTCDPCKNVRGDIQDTEQKNLENIHSGTEITHPDYYSGDDVKITASLTEEQAKTEEEVRLLKEQLDKLERAEKFMLECYDWIDSLSDFLIKKTNFTENEWPFRKIKFWEEISIRGDWTTFYCPVSGTIMGEAEYTASVISPETMKELEEAVVTEIPEPVEPTACTTGIPVGEIIDRTKRISYKLVERMEELIELDKQLIDAVDKLQVLVSQCSSKRGCERRCTCFHCGCGHHPCIDRCQGWIYCCADSSGSYPSTCKDRDEDTPCPYEDIDKQLGEIQRIWGEMRDIIEGKDSNDTPENIGIIPIIKKVIPKILEDLEIIIRERMKTCISEIPSDISDSEEAFKNLMLLSNCESAIRGVGPDGIIIQNCCLEQDEFQECLGLCYLQEGNKKYKDCLQKCLEEKAKELEAAGFKEEAEILKTCRHKLNFYCCGG